jgi:hypothetical protein
MIKVYGYSDDNVEIDDTLLGEDEIGCFDEDVIITFRDGTIIKVGYCKPGIGVWYIIVEKQGTATQTLTVCNDEYATPYSDIFEIDSEILSYKCVPQARKSADTCVCCGAVIPEGRQVCPNCEQ